MVDAKTWTPEIGIAMAAEDDVELIYEKWQQVLKAYEFYQNHASVPPIR